jgi:hypothetical protein
MLLPTTYNAAKENNMPPACLLLLCKYEAISLIH